MPAVAALLVVKKTTLELEYFSLRQPSCPRFRALSKIALKIDGRHGSPGRPA
jgi:hypothetical protein